MVKRCFPCLSASSCAKLFRASAVRDGMLYTIHCLFNPKSQTAKKARSVSIKREFKRSLVRTGSDRAATGELGGEPTFS